MSMKGQVAMEFLTIVMYVFVLFIALYIGTNSYRQDVVDKERSFLARDVALLINGEIYIAYDSLDGYYRVFSLPENLVGTSVYNYSAKVISNTLIVRSGDADITYPVPVETASFNIGGENRIRKKGGNVTIN